MWFTEDPWPPVLILALFAIVFGLAWHHTHRGLYFLITLGLVALGGVVFLVEELIKTESEVVEDRVYALAESVEDGDPKEVVEFISTDAGALREEIGSRMQDVDVDEGLRISDVQVTMDPTGMRAISHFRANGMGTWKKTISHSFATRWNLTWQKEGESWKVILIEQLHPVNDEVINEWRSY